MSSKVYFAKAGGRSGRGPLDRVAMLFDEAGFADAVSARDLIAVKVHFGERGGTAFVRPTYIRAVVGKILDQGAKPFLTDTGCLYFSGRANARDHLVVAAEHGFGMETTLAPVLIADGLRGTDVKPVAIDGKHFSSVDVAAAIHDANALVVITHVTGHGLTGFAGTLKNLGMGAAGRRMKLAIHNMVKPLVNEDKCDECQGCLENCPVGAISLGERIEFDYDVCIGCGECLAMCPNGAIKVEWRGEPGVAQEKLAEITGAVLANKKDRACFFNFMLDVTPTCDCWNYSAAPSIADVGVLASKDPIAIDQASFDLANEAAKAEGRISEALYRPGYARQLEYGEELGLGTRDYELVTIGD